MKNKLLYFVIITFLTLPFVPVSAQNFGGEITLKFTYEGAPLVGYTITASINKVNIYGGVGKTNSEGIVNLNTEPLPVGNIDVKGEITCNNSSKKFEASGFVYVSPNNGNYYELKLEKVAEQMAELSGMATNVIMESFGVNCPGALGGDPSNSTSQNTTSQNTNINLNSANNTSNTTETSVSQSDTIKNDHNAWSIENDKKRQESAAKRKEFMSGQNSGDGYQNQRNMLMNQISKLDKKIGNRKEDLDESKNKKERNEIAYDIKELIVEKALKQNKLAKVNAIIAKGNVPLNKSEKASFKQREEVLNEELEQVKKDRKKGVSILSKENDSTSENNVESGSVDDIDLKKLGAYSESEVKNMSDIKLKSSKVSVKTKLGQKKMSLKAKAKIMSQDEKAILEMEIELLDSTKTYIESEIELRKEAENKD